MGIHRFYIRGYEAKLRDAIRVKLVLVAEGHRFERENRFARVVDRLDPVLETFARDDRAQATVSVYDYCYASSNRYPTDSGDKCGFVSSFLPDADGIGLTCNTRVADVDIAIAGGEVKTGFEA